MNHACGTVLCRDRGLRFGVVSVATSPSSSPSSALPRFANPRNVSETPGSRFVAPATLDAKNTVQNVPRTVLRKAPAGAEDGSIATVRRGTEETRSVGPSMTARRRPFLTTVGDSETALRLPHPHTSRDPVTMASLVSVQFAASSVAPLRARPSTVRLILHNVTDPSLREDAKGNWRQSG